MSCQTAISGSAALLFALLLWYMESISDIVARNAKVNQLQGILGQIRAPSDYAKVIRLNISMNYPIRVRSLYASYHILTHQAACPSIKLLTSSLKEVIQAWP